MATMVSRSKKLAVSPGQQLTLSDPLSILTANVVSLFRVRDRIVYLA